MITLATALFQNISIAHSINIPHARHALRFISGALPKINASMMELMQIMDLLFQTFHVLQLP